MPEVAEVARTVEFLSYKLKNKTLISVDFISGRYIKTAPASFTAFNNSLPLKVAKISSKGKFIWFDLYDSQHHHWYIFNTLGLNGMWGFTQPKYCRAIFTFTSTSRVHSHTELLVYFADMRNFGTFIFTPTKTLLTKKLAQLAPDALKEETFNVQALRTSRRPIVALLQDQQKFCSGIGNYLSAEILYRAAISPHRLSYTLTNKEMETLIYQIKYTTKLAYVDNHTGYMVNLVSIVKNLPKRTYHPNIKLGKNNTFVFCAYRQKTDPYGNIVLADKIVSGRTTYWVPAIQK